MCQHEELGDLGKVCVVSSKTTAKRCFRVWSEYSHLSVVRDVCCADDQKQRLRWIQTCCLLCFQGLCRSLPGGAAIPWLVGLHLAETIQIRCKCVEAVPKQREQLRALTECVEVTKECLKGAVVELLKHGESIETLDAKRGKLSKENQELYKMFN